MPVLLGFILGVAATILGVYEYDSTTGRAGNGLPAGPDRGDDRDGAADDLADGGAGRSVVGIVPPATDWSWFGPSHDPEGRDH